MGGVELASLPESALLDFLREQRWFGARGREPVGASIVDAVELEAAPEAVAVWLVEVRYAAGDHDVYQLLVADTPGSGLRDALGEGARVLMRLLGAEATACSPEGAVEFCRYGAGELADGEAWALGVQQSNSSVVVADRVIVKVYRRLEAGVNPELELLRFLADHGFANVPAVEGWWSYGGPPMSATLGTAQSYLPTATDGWTLALADAAARPEAFLERVPRLGEVIGSLHAVLASDADDPAFAPEEASAESLALVRASLDDEITRLFENLPSSDAAAPLAGRGDAVRDLLGELASYGVVGKLIRQHGDLHLGQVLWAGGDWFVVDFEGEPLRGLPERRLKRSPLRDVAGMLRSFDYAALVTDAGEDSWFARSARERFLESYLGVVERTGILPPRAQAERLIEMFELEKAIYELRYELAHRPDWVYIPVAGIEHLLERAGSA
jgi:maltokinase